LCRLSSLIQARLKRDVLAARELHWADLEAHHEGLICLSGGPLGWLERLLQLGSAQARVSYSTPGRAHFENWVLATAFQLTGCVPFWLIVHNRL
jgi:DNA polymerase III alpha subunit